MDPDYALFARIVEARSLSGAARSLRISPAMVSKRLARLELRLGTQLLRRTTRRLELTESGAGFHKDVLAIMAAIDDAESRLAGRASEPSGPLRITAPTSFGRLHVAPLLAEFLRSYPKVDVELDLSDDFRDLLTDRIDLAVRITADVGRGLIAERLATSRRVLCASPAYLEAFGGPTRIGDLPQHRILATRGQLPWRLASARCPLLFEGESLVSTNSSEVVRELALAGVGIALRSLWDVGPDLAAGRLIRVLPDHEGSADVSIFALQPAARLIPASASLFAALLRARFQPTPPWELPTAAV
ncbi:MAG: LysR family transcriptional regulator [Sphingomonas sp.]|nr:LysR family transcriptional regulator [Sphingomonas sp.]